MRFPSSVCCWILGGLCLILSVSVILLFEYNGRRQGLLQVRQQELNQGFLGPEARKITGQVLEDMAASSREHLSIRRILRLYGYTVAPAVKEQGEAPGPAPEAGDADQEQQPDPDVPEEEIEP